jgi:hypothetical protein
MANEVDIEESETFNFGRRKLNGGGAFVWCLSAIFRVSNRPALKKIREFIRSDDGWRDHAETGSVSTSKAILPLVLPRSNDW